jgi:hypothetical protein
MFQRSILPPSTTQKMEATDFYAMLISLYQNTWCHIPEDYNINIHCHPMGNIF